jgi:CrcB protein
MTGSGAEGDLGMAEPSDEVSSGAVAGDGSGGELRDLPVDPDVEGVEPRQKVASSAARDGRPRRSRWPRVHWITVAVVAAGGFVGGAARYGVGLAWSAPSGKFPWPTWGVNTAGAFILGLLLVLVLEVLPPTRYVRALVGTGFCGGLTTFSSVATGVDQLAAHGHLSVAVGYAFGSLAAGLAAASFGIVIGRSIAAYREEGR